MSSKKFKIKKVLKSLFDIPWTLMEKRFKKVNEAKSAYVPLSVDDSDSESAKEYKTLMNNHRGYFYGEDPGLIQNPCTEEDYRSNVDKIKKLETDAKPMLLFDRVFCWIIVIGWYLILAIIGIFILTKLVILAAMLFILIRALFHQIIPSGHFDPATLNLLDMLARQLCAPFLAIGLTRFLS